MKKLLAMFLAAAMILAALSGCTNTPSDSTTAQTESKQEDTKATEKTADTEAQDTDAPESTEEASADEEGGWTGEVEPIVLTYIHGGTDNPYVDQALEQINDYIRDKIGVEVSAKQVSVFDAASQYTMWIGGGETIDLMTIAFAPVSIFTAMNMLEPLDDLLVNAPYIQQLAEEGKAIYAPSTDGHIYAISAIGEATGNGDGMYFWKEDIEAIGADYQDNDLLTLDQIDELVRKVHEMYPDSYVGVYGSAPRSGFTFQYDPLGADITSGVILGTDSTEVVNYFETEEYQKYLELHRGWYLDGIVKKDAATTDALESGSMTSDPENCRMMWNSYDIGIISQYEGSVGKEIVAFRTKEAVQAATTDVGGFTGIPVTSAHPEAAMRFMNILYSDPFVYTTFLFGMEGVNFDYTDENHNAIIQNADNYYVGLGVIGNTALAPQIGVYDADQAEKTRQFTEEVASNPTKGFGFLYNPANMTNQITAIEAVLQEYRAALETGSADIDTVYPDFIQKLKQNGIDDVIADKQAQFDAWLAQQ